MRFIITAPADVTVELHIGTEICEQLSEETVGENTAHVFSKEPNETDIFWVRAFGEGYYDLSKNIEPTDKEVVELYVNPGRIQGNGFETLVLHHHADSAMAKMLPVKKEWQERYHESYETPTMVAYMARKALGTAEPASLSAGTFLGGSAPKAQTAGIPTEDLTPASTTAGTFLEGAVSKTPTPGSQTEESAPKTPTAGTITEKDTPKSPNVFTTNEEMDAFFDALPQNFTRLTLGETKSEMHGKLSLLIFTRSEIGGEKNMDKIAEILKDSGRLNILYLAQIHGTEMAAGETAMAIAKALSDGRDESILDRANILMVPRVNPDGAQRCQRKNVADDIDMNRDYIRVKSHEVSVIEDLYRAFRPEVVIDGHEYTTSIHQKTNSLRDVLLGIGGGVNTDKTLVGCSKNVTNEVIRTLNEEGICATYYPAPEYCGAVRSRTMVDSANWATGRSYFSMMGSVSILVESMGYHFGWYNFERRCVSHFITIWNLLKNFSKNREEVQAAVKRERESLSMGGGSFSKEKTFCLWSGSTFEKFEKCWSPKYDFLTGEPAGPADAIVECPYYDKAERERPRATAYALSKDVENIEKVLEIVKKHHFDFREIAPSETVLLCQYEGAVEPLPDTKYFKVPEATLSAEKEVRFKNGGYFFPCNQYGALLLMYLFEPDITDTETFGSSFTQAGLLKPEDIYRYERNL